MTRALWSRWSAVKNVAVRHRFARCHNSVPAQSLARGGGEKGSRFQSDSPIRLKLEAACWACFHKNNLVYQQARRSQHTHTHADRREQCLQQPHSLVILSSVSGWMFCPGKEQLSRVTAAAHSVSRWINQSVFRLGPSISGNNLGDIIKVPFCHSRGQGALLPSLFCNFYFSPLTLLLPLLSWEQEWIK